ncbi:DUF371 domain-containing protein [Streptomyces sp. CB02460]|uniref:DUF371 domain-containing protein n=1 Tax=Streptomyces sp. CB02460 TaxID=1703941 RepID=UPI00093CC999|nr:DUF371 domain-containing protein [Streptomyces sp. CB02460]OKJ74178.1 hypothetical protein AMK30_16925 [Streptomyces sp. CB02460]
MKIHAKGHAHVRATHAKTLEFTGEREITPRATCVVGVGAAFDQEGLALLRGPVAVRLAAGPHVATGTAVVNPHHEVTDRLVLRRSDHASPDTFAFRSSLVASDLDPDFVAALGDPATEVTLTLTETGPRRPLVLVHRRGLPEPEGRPGLLWRAADASVDLDTARVPDEARAALADGGVIAASVSGALEGVSQAAGAWLADAAAQGARFEVTGDATGTVSALLAAGLPVAPAVHLGRTDRRALAAPAQAELARTAPAPVVFRASAADLGVLAEVLAGSAEDRRIAVPDGHPDLGHGVTWLPLSEAVGAVGGEEDERVFVLAPPERAAWNVDLRPLLPLLVEQGVTARTLSTVLRPFGISRRELYDALGDAPADRSASASQGASPRNKGSRAKGREKK